MFHLNYTTVSQPQRPSYDASTNTNKSEAVRSQLLPGNSDNHLPASVITEPTGILDVFKGRVLEALQA